MVAGNNKHNRKSIEIGEVKVTSPLARKTAGRRRFNAALALGLLFVVQALMVGQALAQSNQATYDGTGNGTFQDGSLTGAAAGTSATTQNYNVPAVPFMTDTNTDVPINVKGGNGTPGIGQNVNKLLKRDNPNGVADQQPDAQQPKVFIPGQNLGANSTQNFDQSLANQTAAGQQASSLFVQAAEQNNAGLTNNPQGSVNNILNQSLGSINETYRGMHQWFNDDLIGNLFSQIGQLNRQVDKRTS